MRTISLEPHAMHMGAALFRAMGDEDRLAILEHIVDAGGEVPAPDLAKALGSNELELARHLADLRAARLIRKKLQGDTAVWALSSAEVPAILDALKSALVPSAPNA